MKGTIFAMATETLQDGLFDEAVLYAHERPTPVTLAKFNGLLELLATSEAGSGEMHTQGELSCDSCGVNWFDLTDNTDEAVLVVGDRQVGGVLVNHVEHRLGRQADGKLKLGSSGEPLSDGDVRRLMGHISLSGTPTAA